MLTLIPPLGASMIAGLESPVLARNLYLHSIEGSSNGACSRISPRFDVPRGTSLCIRGDRPRAGFGPGFKLNNRLGVSRRPCFVWLLSRGCSTWNIAPVRAFLLSRLGLWSGALIEGLKAEIVRSCHKPMTPGPSFTDVPRGTLRNCLGSVWFPGAITAPFFS